MCTELVLDPQGRLVQMNRLPGDNDVGRFLEHSCRFKLLQCDDADNHYNHSSPGGNGRLQDEDEDSRVPRGQRCHRHLQ